MAKSAYFLRFSLFYVKTKFAFDFLICYNKEFFYYLLIRWFCFKGESYEEMQYNKNG